MLHTFRRAVNKTKNEYNTYHTFVIQTEERDKLKKYLYESGIETNADLNRVLKFGVERFLVGESLMKNHDITKATKILLGA